MKPTLVVLAAGMGSRYGGVKQMDGFGPNGQWLLEYSIYDAINAGFGKVVFILRAAIVQDFKDYFTGRLPEGITAEYVIQSLDNLPKGYELPEGRVKPWGTGHAMLVTKDVVKENFAIINADDYYGRDAFQQMAAFLSELDPKSHEFGIAGYYLRNTLSDHGTVNRGICSVNDAHQLTTIEEHIKIYRNEAGTMVCDGEGSMDEFGEDTVVSMNFFGFTPAVFDKTEEYFTEFLDSRINEEKSEYFIPLIVQRVIDEGIGHVSVKYSNDSWFGVTYQNDAEFVRTELKGMHNAGHYPDNLWS